MKKNFPNRITFQWHITDQCNFRCKHCYQDSYDDVGGSYNQLLTILNKLYNFTEAAKMQSPNFKAHINFTGGEPFIRKDFLKLLEATKKTGLFSYAILSNGYLLSQDELQKLKQLSPRFIQISLEGGKLTNEYIRGQGSYLKITKALKTYRQLRIPVMISFTANSTNYKEFPQVVRIGRKYKVFKVWTDRYLPNGNSDKLLMSTDQVKEFFQIIKKEQSKTKYYILSQTKISSDRALQFLVSGGRPYRCSAGKTLLAILPNGDILPCRRLPIKVGNILYDNLIDIYLNDSTLIDIRNPIEADGCKDCYYNSSCEGGLKCLSHALTKTYIQKDPNCWI